MIISLATTKGGSGKSTLALNLAATLSKLDFPTMLIDTDPQGSLNRAFQRRDTQPEKIQKTMANDLSFEWETTGAIVDKLDRYRPAGIIVVDAFGYDHPLQWSIIQKSDVVLIPSSLGYQDVEVALEVAEKAATVSNARLIINHHRKNSVLSSYIREFLSGSPSVKLHEPYVYDRQAYALSFAAGLAACEADPRSSAAKEFDAFTQSLIQSVGIR